MSLKIKIGRQEPGDPVWFHVGRTAEGKLIGWRDEDEEALPLLAEIEKQGKVLVSPMDLVAFSRAQDRVRKRYVQLRDKRGELPREISKRVSREAFAKVNLHGWEDLEFGDGDEISGEYTPAKGAQALNLSEEFEHMVVTLADLMSDERQEELAEDTQTLGNASAGSSGGRKRRGTKGDDPA